MKFKLVKLKKSDPIFNSGFIFTNQKIKNRNKSTSQNSEDEQKSSKKLKWRSSKQRKIKR